MMLGMPVKVMAGEPPGGHTLPVEDGGAPVQVPVVASGVPVIGISTVAGLLMEDRSRTSLPPPPMIDRGGSPPRDAALVVTVSSNFEPFTVVTHRSAAELQPGVKVTPPMLGPVIDPAARFTS